MSKDGDQFRMPDNTIFNKVPYEEIEVPLTTGSRKITFWQSDTGLFYVRISGGCVAHLDILFGPYKAAGGGFELLSADQSSSTKATTNVRP